MTDITKIAAACASRIMDRMEMSRGSAMLKSDTEREVEIALREMIGAPKATPASIADKALKALADAHTPEFSGLNFAVPYAGFRFRVDGDTLIHEPIPQEEMYGVLDEDCAGVRGVDHLKGTSVQAIIGKPYTVQQAKKDFDEAYEEAAAENAKRIANVCA